jgi:hypothetical protein
MEYKGYQIDPDILDLLIEKVIGTSGNCDRSNKVQLRIVLHANVIKLLEV